MNKDATKVLKVWETLAHKILAVCLTDQAAIGEIIEEIGSDKELFPSDQSDIWEAVTDLYFGGDLPTVESVAAKLAGDIEPGFIKLVKMQYTEEDDENLIYNAKSLFKISQVARIRKLGRQLSTVTEYDTMVNKLGSTQREIDSVITAQNSRQRTPTELMAGIDHLIEMSGSGIPTGMKFFDDMTGGSWVGMNYWIGGAYKSGKSTLMRNIALTALLTKQPVEIYAAESGAEVVALQFIVMLAILRMRESGIMELPNLSAQGVLQNYAYFRQNEMIAFQEAKIIFEDMPIAIYDTSDGIRKLSNMAAKVKRAKNDRGCRLFFADHSLLFGSEIKGNTYERVSEVARTVQDLAVDEKIAFWMLSQKNEDSIRNTNTASAGLKGGGDPAAAADYIFNPKIDSEAGNILEIRLSFSRHTRTKTESVIVHPSSGLIL